MLLPEAAATIPHMNSCTPFKNFHLPHRADIWPLIAVDRGILPVFFPMLKKYLAQQQCAPRQGFGGITLVIGRGVHTLNARPTQLPDSVHPASARPIHPAAANREQWRVFPHCANRLPNSAPSHPRNTSEGFLRSILATERIFRIQTCHTKKSARSKGFIANHAILTQNPRKHEDST